MKKIFIIILLSPVFSSITIEKAPFFYLKSIDKKDYFLTDQYDKKRPVLLSFFATWCIPCRKELPLLDSLSYVYEDIDFNYLAVGSENKPIKSGNIIKFKKDLNLTQNILMDKYGRVFEKFSKSGSLPLTVLISATGEILYLTEKFDIETSINSLVDELNIVINED